MNTVDERSGLGPWHEKSVGLLGKGGRFPDLLSGGQADRSSRCSPCRLVVNLGGREYQLSNEKATVLPCLGPQSVNWGHPRRVRAQPASSNEFQISLVRAICGASPDGILVVDDKANVISPNQRFLGVWGIPNHRIHIARSSRRTAEPSIGTSPSSGASRGGASGASGFSGISQVDGNCLAGSSPQRSPHRGGEQTAFLRTSR